jgi:hypothetical protein
MKIITLITGLLIASPLAAFAGKPILLTLAEACSQADCVLVATVSKPVDLPDGDPFAATTANERFTQSAKTSEASGYLGEVHGLPVIFGGKAPGGTDYRIESGRYFLLLKHIDASAYRAVDWHYSFLRIKDGKVEWLIDRETQQTELITIEEAVMRVNNYKREAKAEMATPRKPSD